MIQSQVIQLIEADILRMPPAVICALNDNAKKSLNCSKISHEFLINSYEFTKYCLKGRMAV